MIFNAEGHNSYRLNRVAPQNEKGNQVLTP